LYVNNSLCTCATREKRAARRAAAEAEADKRAADAAKPPSNAAHMQEAPAWVINGAEQQILQLEMHKRSASQAGFTLAPVPASILKTGGLYVDVIVPHSAADECGLKVYDRLLELNEDSVRRISADETLQLLDAIPVGTAVTLLVARDASVAENLKKLDTMDDPDDDEFF